VRLEPLTREQAEALIAGGSPDLPVAPGWPHDATRFGLAGQRRGGRVWLVVDDDGRVAGDCGTTAGPASDGTVEIGYGLAAPSRGRGLGGRAVAALIAELRGDPAIRSVTAEVHETNAASRRLLARLGFVRTGPAGDGHDVFELSLDE
jgi:RimJ/RimL family protein N-acetyltransferase